MVVLDGFLVQNDTSLFQFRPFFNQEDQYDQNAGLENQSMRASLTSWSDIVLVNIFLAHLFIMQLQRCGEWAITTTIVRGENSKHPTRLGRLLLLNGTISAPSVFSLIVNFC